MAKRLVHDILSQPNRRKPVAFIQHGNPSDGYTYEAICPFCAVTIEHVKPHTDRVDDLYNTLLRSQKQHWLFCPANKGIAYATDMQVEIATAPLHTETPLKESVH
jgi:hypothetical protein